MATNPYAPLGTAQNPSAGQHWATFPGQAPRLMPSVNTPPGGDPWANANFGPDSEFGKAMAGNGSPAGATPARPSAHPMGLMAGQMPAAPQSAAPTMPQGYSPSPYLQDQIGALQTQFQNNLNRNVLPQIQSNAIGAGGYGGSRQGIAEGLAGGEAATGFANAASNLLGQDYQAQMNRNLQQYQGDQSYTLGNKNSDQNYALGQGNLALGNKQADNSFTLGQGQLALGNLNANNNFTLGQGQNQNTANQIANQYSLGNQGQMLDFYGNQRQQDLNALQVGGNLYNQGITGAWNPITQANNVFGTYAGNGTTTSTSNTGGGALGAVGGALGAATLANNLGWWK